MFRKHERCWNVHTEDGSVQRRESAGLDRLVKQITTLQSKNAELLERALTSQNNLQDANERLESLQRELQALSEEHCQLQKNHTQLRLSKVLTI